MKALKKLFGGLDLTWPKLIIAAVIAGAAVVVITVVCLLNPPVYSVEVMGSGDEYRFDDSCSVYLANEKYGDVDIRYMESLEDYMLHADFRRAGDTVLTLELPDGGKTEFDIHIERDKFEFSKRNSGETNR